MKQIVPIVVLAILVGSSCTNKPTPGLAPESDDSFYSTARFIMTDEEQEIYKHLPSEEARQEFIDEFWQKRDPTPETEINENKQAFQERIAYANRWFREPTSGSRGWDTERGRILLQLGFPDERRFGEYTPTSRTPGSYGRLLTTKRYPMERWIYYRYNLVLTFIDQSGHGDKLRLMDPPATLLTALDQAKFSLDLRDKQELKRAFRFNAECDAESLRITVPTKKISFEERDGQMSVELNYTIYVYRDYRKVDTLSDTKTLRYDETEVLNKKEIQFAIPYRVTEPGKYYFDIIIEETLSASKYRNFCEHKLD